MPSLAAPLLTTEVRIDEILGSIRQTFAEKGFDGASMQDLARAAGMSVGNFYRYFPSKAAIVAAMCSLDLHEIEREFSDALSSPDPMAELRDGILDHISGHDREDGQLWAEITAAAIRKPEIAAASSEMEEKIVQHIASIFAHVTRRSVADAVTRYRGQCLLLIMLVKASTIRCSQFGPPDAVLTSQIVWVIDQILAQISTDTPEG
jgi:AcrR family transcriptional regulator